LPGGAAQGVAPPRSRGTTSPDNVTAQRSLPQDLVAPEREPPASGTALAFVVVDEKTAVPVPERSGAAEGRSHPPSGRPPRARPAEPSPAGTFPRKPSPPAATATSRNGDTLASD